MTDSGGQSSGGYGRLTVEQMDQQRIEGVAYKYLCHLEEAKRWMEACLGEELPPSTELEDSLRNGVLLAKLGHHFSPDTLSLKKIYDLDQTRYKAVGLHFRHTDNINHWKIAMTRLGLPSSFYPETTDLYDKKNIPRVVYCLHALSVYLYKLGLAPQIHDLYGKVNFREEEINNVKLELDKYGIQMPVFKKIGGILANELSVNQAAVEAALLNLNHCLRASDPKQTVSCLMTTALDLPLVYPSAARLYHCELQQIQRQSPEGEVQQEELFVAVEMLSAVAVVNEALDVGLMQKFSSSLVSSSAALSDVEPELLHKYYKALRSLKQQSNGAILNWNQLQNVINTVNSVFQKQHQQLICVSMINEAVKDGDTDKLISSLRQPSLDLNGILPNNTSRYLILLRRAQQYHAQVCRDPEVGLWLMDIQEVVVRANRETQKAHKMCLALAAVNQAIQEQIPSQIFRVLSLPDLALSSLVPHCAQQYQEQLSALIKEKAKRDNCSAWVRIEIDNGTWFYFNLNKLDGTWDKPRGFSQNSPFLSRSDIQSVVDSVSAQHSRSLQWKNREQLVVHLQAALRGFLLRRQLQMRYRYLSENMSSIITMQSHWRRVLVQRSYHRRLQYLYMNWRAVVKIQSMVRMWLVRKRYRERKHFFIQHVNAVVKIQAFVRANKARKEYKLLVRSATPPLYVIRKFAQLLELSGADITEETELLRVRQEVVRTIRFNKQLETDLNLMDLKIGLLVRNQVTLQEVATHCNKLTKKNKEQLSVMMNIEKSKGLRALSRERRERLEAYQHLFYLLQTQPWYLAQLIFLMPQSRSTVFMEMLVFSLFNYGSDQREAFLLLQLFTQALRYEIRLKVEQPQDVVTGNPTVIKMLVNFYRHARGHNALRETLGPVLRELLQEQNLSIRTDPLEVYKTWVNQMETQTGTKSSFPYDVSPEEALSHPEVQRRIDVAIVNLGYLTDRVLKAITSNLHILPYGLRYTAKVLKNALKEKFSEAPEDDIYKLVGNLVYYRYMNPAIVAPDGFDVLDRSVSFALSLEQRHLLAAIARLLQHAATNKRFHGDGYHIHMLNQYIASMHLKFRRFLMAVCDVPEPEDRFNVDEFSELLIVNKPVIYVSLNELINTHQLLVDHQSILSPDLTDPLSALLQDLGSVPTLQMLSGTAGDECLADSDIGKTEVSLILTNKFDIFNDEQDHLDARGILLSTKQMIIDVILIQPGDNLAQILRTSASQQQVVHHDQLVQTRAWQDTQTLDKLKRHESLMANGSLSLEQKKRKILRNLRCLETMGVLQALNTEGAILSMIAKDIRQQRLHRQRRGTELMRLRQTLNSLQAKSSFHSEQIDFYHYYTTSCLDKLINKKAAKSRSKKKVLSYSATRLQEKGVLLEIEDLPPTQFKNVLFDIGLCSEKGSFSVKASFLGVQMEEFTLKYQDLLQLQYDGVAVMKMFNKAKVNVNLLIFLLNKMFYNK